MPTKRFRTALILIVGAPMLLIAQQQTTCEQRIIPATVVDASGQQMLGLTAEQFRGSFEGAPVKVVSAKFGSASQRILMLVDVSSSVSCDDSQQWELVKLVADDMVSAGPSKAELALATFSSRVETNVRFGQSRESVREAILGLKPTCKPTSSPAAAAGETALNDAILEAADMFGNPQPGDVVYVITDGLDNESKSSIRRVRQYLEQRNIRLFASLIHNNHFTPLTGAPFGWERGPELVANTAKETGGYPIIFEADRPRKALDKRKNAVHQLYDMMASFYLLYVKLPIEPDKPRELKLTVVNAKGDKTKGAMALYPQNVFPCPEPK